MIPRIFEGETMFIVAGGASLMALDFDRLIGKKHIALNFSLRFCPQADILYFTDAHFFRENREEIEAHAAPWKASGHINQEPGTPDWLHVYRLSAREGFDPDPTALRHGNTSTYAAMHLCAHIGVKRIVLLGVDMCLSPEGRTHYYDGHEYPERSYVYVECMVPFFAGLYQPFKNMGIEVLNASPKSQLKIWPRISLEEAMSLT